MECLRKVAEGDPWLDSRGVRMGAAGVSYARGRVPRPRAPRCSSLPKESLIVSCVTQGMKNKEIALRVGTTEQVVKNYLRKVYDKLGVADRLELALFCLNNRVVERVPTLRRLNRAHQRQTAAAAAAAALRPASNCPEASNDSQEFVSQTQFDYGALAPIAPCIPFSASS